MFLRLFKLLVAALFGLTVLVGCGGGSAAPAPTGLAVTPGDGGVTVTWDAVPGVEYWLFCAPTLSAPTDVAATQKWVGLCPAQRTVNGALQIINGVIALDPMMNVTSPYAIPSGLVNGTSYSFTVNGRTNDGPGGPGAAAVSATPRLAGANWTTGATTGIAALRSVAFGTVYVAVGDGGAMYSSTDGANWSPIGYAVGSKLNGASFLVNYKLVGDGGVVLTSPDAITWTSAVNIPTTSNLNAIASDGVSLNVAVGAGGTIIYSSDQGATWNLAAYSGAVNTNALYAVTHSAYNVGTNTAGTWLAVGAGGTMVQSPDGITWSVVASGTSEDLRGIAYGTSAATAAGVFVEVTAAGTALGSANGTTWTPQALTSGPLNAVTFATQFVAVGAGGRIFYSTDGSTWTAAAPATANDLYAVARGTLAYIAVGAAGTNLLSR